MLAYDYFILSMLLVGSYERLQSVYCSLFFCTKLGLPIRRKNIAVFPLTRPTQFQIHVPDSVTVLISKMQNKTVKHRLWFDVFETNLFPS